MKIYVVKTLIGVFGLDENRKVVLFRVYAKDPVKMAEKFLSEESEEYKTIKQEALKKTEDVVENDRDTDAFVNQNLRKYALELKFAKDNIELNQLLAQINLEITKKKVKAETSRDNLVIHAVNAIEEFDRSANVFVERLRELYGLHFPEMDRAVSDHEKFAKLVGKYGNKEAIDEPELRKLSSQSMGIDFTTRDTDMVKQLASNILKLYELRKTLSGYLSNLLKEIAPNFSAIAGDLIAAKLIAKAGGIERLSRMPSSTIQLLGSEKALFRFLKSRKKSKSPKYGLIYNHPLIQNAPQEKRGKIARLLAAKLSIAVKIDYYSKENKAAQMKKDLESKVKEVLSE